MNRGKRLAVVSSLILVGLVLYAAFPLTARADDSTPPPPTDPAATPAPDSAVDSSGNPVGPSTTDLSALTGAIVVPLDSSGNPVPLATNEAASILTTGDPIWCPSGAAPAAGLGGCTAANTDLASLVTLLSGSQPTQNGIIWITAGSDSSAPAAMNGGALTTWSAHALTVQGGWDGTSAGRIVGTTTLNHDLSITNWGNNLSLNDLIFSGAGATLSTTGNININDVEVKNHAGIGLSLTSLAGLASNVTVSNSNFHNNTSTGLAITSNSVVGNVKLTNVIASSNGGLGANISMPVGAGTVSISASTFNENASTGLNVDLLGNGDVNVSHVTADQNNIGAILQTSHGDINLDNSQFSQNQLDGLQALASGSISADTITVSQNDSLGVLAAAGYLSAGPTGNITINTGTFDNNSNDALVAQAGGSITLAQVTVNNNQSGGSSQAAAMLSAGSSGNISISESAFSNNRNDGLNAQAGGSISLTDVTAEQNQSGAHTGAAANLAAGPSGNIDILRGTFDQNVWDGLRAVAGGSISAHGVEVNNNETGGHTNAGAFLVAGGNVTIDSTSAFNYNSWTGLQASAGSSIGLSDVQANGNTHIGALLQGGTHGNIAVTNGTFSGNGWDGLQALTGGNIVLTNTHADSNGSTGTTYGGAGLVANGDITILPDSSFNDNEWDGLYAATLGNIQLSGVTANGNDHSGVSLAGTYLVTGALGSISIDSSVFDNNYRDGLRAATAGSLTVSSVSASGNQITAGSNAAAFLVASGPIKISYSVFSNNRDDGLHATSSAGITLMQVLAQSNGLAGHLTAGTDLISGGSINVSNSDFSSNKFDGLHATASNSITLDAVKADSNNSSGITNAGTYLVAGGSITIDPTSYNGKGLPVIAGSSFSQNAGVGLMAQAGTTVLMQHVDFIGNGGDGAQITAGSNVTSACDNYDSNGGYGIDATLPGKLALLGDTFAGNVSGDFHLAGGGTSAGPLPGTCGGKEGPYKTPTPKPSYLLGSSPTPAPSAAAALTLNVVNVSEGQALTLDCGSFLGTTLALPNRDQVVIMCPITGSATLKHLTSDTLPSPLASGMTYLSSMDAEVTQGGQPSGTLNGPMKVDFAIPSGQTDTSKLALLRWDGTQWVDLGGAATQTGYIESVTNQTGVFVLVSR